MYTWTCYLVPRCVFYFHLQTMILETELDITPCIGKYWLNNKESKLEVSLIHLYREQTQAHKRSFSVKATFRYAELTSKYISNSAVRISKTIIVPNLFFITFLSRLNNWKCVSLKALWLTCNRYLVTNEKIRGRNKKLKIQKLLFSDWRILMLSCLSVCLFVSLFLQNCYFQHLANL